MIWYTELYKLQGITRYSNIPRNHDENVAQHSFFVSSLCIELYNELKDTMKLDLGNMLLIATVHDWPEAEIDDVAHNVKRKYPKVKEALQEAELEYISKYPTNVINAFVEYLEGKTPDSKVVHLADAMQCVQYTKVEVKTGNEYMIPVLQESERRVRQLRKELKWT